DEQPTRGVPCSNRRPGERHHPRPRPRKSNLLSSSLTMTPPFVKVFTNSYSRRECRRHASHRRETCSMPACPRGRAVLFFTCACREQAASICNPDSPQRVTRRPSFFLAGTATFP